VRAAHVLDPHPAGERLAVRDDPQPGGERGQRLEPDRHVGGEPPRLVGELGDGLLEVVDGLAVLVLGGVQRDVHRPGRLAEHGQALAADLHRRDFLAERRPHGGGRGLDAVDRAVQVDVLVTAEPRIRRIGLHARVRHVLVEVAEAALREDPAGVVPPVVRHEQVAVPVAPDLALVVEPVGDRRSLEDDARDADGGERAVYLRGHAVDHERLHAGLHEVRRHRGGCLVTRH
jgi:hypothetical protein